MRKRAALAITSGGLATCESFSRITQHGNFATACAKFSRRFTPLWRNDLGCARVPRAGDRVSRSRTFHLVRPRCMIGSDGKNYFGAMPKPARETRALPFNFQRFNDLNTLRLRLILVARRDHQRRRHATSPRRDKRKKDQDPNPQTRM